jgi:hypothetical protein
MSELEVVLSFNINIVLLKLKVARRVPTRRGASSLSTLFDRHVRRIMMALPPHSMTMLKSVGCPLQGDTTYLDNRVTVGL